MKLTDQQRIERLREALQAVHLWASYRGGVFMEPKPVEMLCKKVLRETKPAKGKA